MTLAKELKDSILGERSDHFQVIGFTGNWWHVHDDEEVPEMWMLKLAMDFSSEQKVAEGHWEYYECKCGEKVPVFIEDDRE